MPSLEEKAQEALDLIIALEDAEQDQFKQLVIGQIGRTLGGLRMVCYRHIPGQSGGGRP